MKKKFCEKCGTKLINRVCPKCSQNGSINAEDYERKIKNLFMSQNEKIVAVLGKAYSEKYFQNRQYPGGFVVASDKRLYFLGESYDICNNVFGWKKLRKTNQSKTIDLKDVAGTGGGIYRQKHFISANILLFVLMIIILLMCIAIGIGTLRYQLLNAYRVGILIRIMVSPMSFIPKLFIAVLIAVPISLDSYITQKLHMLTFQYNGGELAFNMTGIAEEEIAFFKRQFCIAKDDATENNIEKSTSKETASSVIQSAPHNRKTDELVKLADLLSKGVISQEEFEKMKREVISQGRETKIENEI